MESPCPFDALVARVQACRRCPTMEGRRRVLSRLNGDPAAPCLVIAEAPGRFGAERTGVPLTSDQSGRTFRRLCAEAGVAAEALFITNAVLCNPRAADDRNRGPRAAELANCREHLAATIEVTAPTLVVTLGRVALAALAALQPHGLQLRAAVGRPTLWDGRLLLPLYHPGPQALLHRPYAVQLDDYRVWARLLREIVGDAATAPRRAPGPAAAP